MSVGDKGHATGGKCFIGQWWVFLLYLGVTVISFSIREEREDSRLGCLQ